MRHFTFVVAVVSAVAVLSSCGGTQEAEVTLDGQDPSLTAGADAEATAEQPLITSGYCQQYNLSSTQVEIPITVPGPFPKKDQFGNPIDAPWLVQQELCKNVPSALNNICAQRYGSTYCQDCLSQRRCSLLATGDISCLFTIACFR